MNEKVTISVRIDKDVLNDVKNIVYWSPGLTMSDFIQDAIEGVISSVKAENSKLVEMRPEKNKRGRRVS